MADGIQKIEGLTGLDLLRAPFLENQISKLPKPTKQQTEAVKADYRKGIRCKLCGGWHHPDVVHLDYVGHAALTDRLLDCDPEWNWEPVVMEGLPNAGNGMWIKLTVCGVSRLGYGDADGKQGGNAVKEIIGDALRNAAMRFGAALDLWHKGDLHLDPEEPPKSDTQPQQPKEPQRMSKEASYKAYEDLQHALFQTKSRDAQIAWFKSNKQKIASLHEDHEALLNQDMKDHVARLEAPAEEEMKI